MGLRERIEEELARRERLADRAHHAEPGQWRVDGPVGTRVVDAAGDGLAIVGVTADAAHIALHDPADALARYAAARRVLALVDKLHQHEAKRREMSPLSGFAHDLRAYADELEASVAASLGIV